MHTPTSSVHDRPPEQSRLRCGPVLRHVGATTATVWVQTDRPGEVEVLGCRAATFTVCANHFALVEITGLEPGTSRPYQVRLDGELVWPQQGSGLPPSRIRSRGGAGPARVVFGSCRHPEPDDPGLAAALGVDSLQAYAVRMAAQRPEATGPDAPATISVLSGDVHHTYGARARFAGNTGSPVYQLVCSPMHHCVPWIFKMLLRAGWTGPLSAVVRRVARACGVPAPPLSWQRVLGPYFGTALATLVLTERDAELVIESAHRVDGRGALREQARIELAPGAVPPGRPAGGR